MTLPPFSLDRAGSDLPSADLAPSSRDPRALRILAKSIYRELRQSGLQEKDVMAVAGELLSLVAGEVKDRREGAPSATAAPAPAPRTGG